MELVIALIIGGIVAYYFFSSKDKKELEKRLTEYNRKTTITRNRVELNPRDTMPNSLKFNLIAPEIYNYNGEILDIKVGDVVKFYPIPNKPVINIYHYKSLAGEGLLGKISSNRFHGRYPYETYRVSSTIIAIDGVTISLDPDLSVVDIVEKANQAIQEELNKLDDRLRKNSKIELAFEVPDQFRWNKKVILVTDYTDEIIEEVKADGDWERLKACFWIVDEEGERQDIGNETDISNVVKLFRALRINNAEINLIYHKGGVGHMEGMRRCYRWRTEWK